MLQLSPTTLTPQMFPSSAAAFAFSVLLYLWAVSEIVGGVIIPLIRRGSARTGGPRFDHIGIPRPCRIAHCCHRLRQCWGRYVAELDVLPRNYPYSDGHRVAIVVHGSAGSVLFFGGEDPTGSNGCPGGSNNVAFEKSKTLIVEERKKLK